MDRLHANRRPTPRASYLPTMFFTTKSHSIPNQAVRDAPWGRIARCARAVHKVCTVPYPNCIVVPSINNNEPKLRSPSPSPSPSQPRPSLLALLEAKQCNPPPSRRSNTPSTGVTTTRGQPAGRSPSASTASSPSLPVQRTSHSRYAPGLGHSRSRGRSPSRSTSKPRPKRGRAPKTTAHSRQDEKERNTTVRPICPSMALEGHSRYLDGFRP